MNHVPQSFVGLVVVLVFVAGALLKLSGNIRNLLGIRNDTLKAEITAAELEERKRRINSEPPTLDEIQTYVPNARLLRKKIEERDRLLGLIALFLAGLLHFAIAENRDHSMILENLLVLSSLAGFLRVATRRSS